MKNIILGLSGIFFGIFAVLHFFRLAMNWTVVMGPISIAPSASLWIGLIALLFSAACFIAAKQK